MIDVSDDSIEIDVEALVLKIRDDEDFGSRSLAVHLGISLANQFAERHQRRSQRLNVYRVVVDPALSAIGDRELLPAPLFVNL